MPVSTELLARYKELKAQGVNITLSELKAQLAAEEQAQQIPAQSLQPEVQPSVVKPEPEPEPVPPQQSQWQTTYSSPVFSQTSEPVQNSYFEQAQTTLQSYSSPEAYTTQDWGVNTSVENVGVCYTEPKTEPSFAPQPEQPKYAGNVSTVVQTQVSSEKMKFALIGYPLGHSLSSYIHDAGFKSLGMNATYEILETPPEKLVDRIKYLKFNKYSGFNVTIPLKLPVTMFLDAVDESADIVNAVNTVVIDPNTLEMKGYNTDVLGFRNAIPADVTLYGKVAGVLGTGGAARAAITALAQSQVKEIKLFTRNIPNSLELVNYLRKTFPSVEFNVYQIERIRDLSDVNILVNTTPIGMQGRAADMTPVEENELKTLPHDAVVYDVIYNPKKTVLLKLAQKNGYRTINGVDMFIHQALAAEQIWTGKTPDFKDMKIAALENL